MPALVLSPCGGVLNVLVWAKTVLEMSVLGYVLCFVALLDYHVHTVAMIVMHVLALRYMYTYVYTCTLADNKSTCIHVTIWICTTRPFISM